jgi:hypothetical protein
MARDFTKQFSTYRSYDLYMKTQAIITGEGVDAVELK